GLTCAGCSVQTASNGMSALRLAADDVPDVALVGPALPEIGPHDLARALAANERTRGIGVVILHDDWLEQAEVTAEVVRPGDASRRDAACQAEAVASTRSVIGSP